MAGAYRGANKRGHLPRPTATRGDQSSQWKALPPARVRRQSQGASSSSSTRAQSPGTFTESESPFGRPSGPGLLLCWAFNHFGLPADTGNMDQEAAQVPNQHEAARPPLPVTRARWATLCPRCGLAIDRGHLIALVAMPTGPDAWTHEHCAGLACRPWRPSKKATVRPTVRSTPEGGSVLKLSDHTGGSLPFSDTVRPAPVDQDLHHRIGSTQVEDDHGGFRDRDTR
jgi:hypothetical protein